jgi:hypothetical protein
LSTTFTGKGGFAVSFYVLLKKRNICNGSSANRLQRSQVAVWAVLARDAQALSLPSLCLINPRANWVATPNIILNG